MVFTFQTCSIFDSNALSQRLWMAFGFLSDCQCVVYRQIEFLACGCLLTYQDCPHQLVTIYTFATSLETPFHLSIHPMSLSSSSLHLERFNEGVHRHDFSDPNTPSGLNRRCSCQKTHPSFPVQNQDHHLLRLDSSITRQNLYRVCTPPFPHRCFSHRHRQLLL